MTAYDSTELTLFLSKNGLGHSEQKYTGTASTPYYTP